MHTLPLKPAAFITVYLYFLLSAAIYFFCYLDVDFPKIALLNGSSVYSSNKLWVWYDSVNKYQNYVAWVYFLSSLSPGNGETSSQQHNGSILSNDKYCSVSSEAMSCKE